MVDASGWKPVYDILVAKGFKVTMVQEPETSFDDDVAATNRVLDLQDGPTLLVGHSYGGSIITEAGMHPNVVGLVLSPRTHPMSARMRGCSARGHQACWQRPMARSARRLTDTPISSPRNSPSCSHPTCRVNVRSSWRDRRSWQQPKYSTRR